MIDLARKWIEAHTRLAVLLGFVGAFVVLFMLMDTTLNTFDEGLVLVGAMRTWSTAISTHPMGPAPNTSWPRCSRSPQTGSWRNGYSGWA